MIGEKLYDLESQNRLLSELNHILKDQVSKRYSHVNSDVSESVLAQKDALTNCIFSDSSSRDISAKFDRLQKLVQEKDEFFKMVNSDLLSAVVQINNAIKSILTSESNVDEESRHKMLEKINYKSKTILKMLYDMSLFQKISNNNLILIRNTHDLTSIITKTVSQIKDDIQRAGCVVTLNLPSTATCYCDANKIQTVITQLLFNAIDFTYPGMGKINIKLQYRDKSALIIIQDNGIGIKPQNLDKIFQSFVQLDTTLQREHRGSGLGLTICKGIIEAHGGRIWADSRGSDTGTEICIELPLENKLDVIRKIE